MFARIKTGKECPSSLVSWSISCALLLCLTACFGGAAQKKDATLGALTKLPAVTIPAKNGWVDAEVYINEGDIVEVAATGSWGETAGAVRGPEGGAAGLSGGGYWQQTRIMPLAPWGSVIGRIGNSTAFPVGAQTRFVAAASGPLQLSINDAPDVFDDNTGSVQARVLTQQPTAGADLSALPHLP